MNDHRHFGDSPGPDNKYAKLASWLQGVLQSPPLKEQTAPAAEQENQLELLLDSHYHLRFYQQLPDFVMALLNSDPTVTTRYAPLLYHLAGCSECHHGYLDLYDAMSAAIHPQEPRPLLGQGTRTLAATPQRMLGHLCQVLISQAEAVQLQARRDHSDDDAGARSLLQLALTISARITQSGIRRSALRDLVRVATLREGTETTKEGDSALYTYTPALSGAGGARGRRAVRRADMPTRPVEQEQPIIHLQARALEGTISQRDETLELHLQDLGPELRGHHVTISVPLGALIEPVRWIGGDPRAIRSTVPVDANGQLTTPLGETALRLSDPEGRNLLEAMFMLLEVRPAS